MERVSSTKGANWDKTSGKWRAQLTVGGKAYQFGVYKEEASAVAAVAAAREALARGVQIDEYVAENYPKRKPAEQQSSTAGHRLVIPPIA